MKCPYCQNEMQLGYIQCRDGVTWTPKKQLVAALSSLGTNAIALDNDKSSASSKTAHAYCCKECEMVIIPYGKLL